jgi:hypothetical protein
MYTAVEANVEKVTGVTITAAQADKLTTAIAGGATATATVGQIQAFVTDFNSHKTFFGVSTTLESAKITGSNIEAIKTAINSPTFMSKPWYNGMFSDVGSVGSKVLFFVTSIELYNMIDAVVHPAD